MRLTLDNVKNKINYTKRKNGNILPFIAYGISADLSLSLYKQFSPKFLERIGGTDFHITLLNSLPGLFVVFLLLPAIILVNKSENLGKMTSIAIFCSRIFLLTFLAIPYVPIAYRAITFVLLISIMKIPEEIAKASAHSYSALLFNDEHRAEAVSLRTKFSRVIPPFIVLIVGYIINDFPVDEQQRMFYYQLLFTFATIVGLFELYFFTKLEPVIEPTVKKVNFDFKDIFKLSDKKFKKYFIVTMVFYFSWQAGWPLMSIYKIQALNIDELWIALNLLASGTVGYLSSGFWKKILYRFDGLTTLFFAVVCMGFNSLFTGLSPNLPLVTLAAAYSGFSISGILISLYNTLLENTPEENRIVYIGVYNTFVNLSLGISPFFGLYLSRETGIQMSIIIVSFMRVFSGIIILLTYKEEIISSIKKYIKKVKG